MKTITTLLFFLPVLLYFAFIILNFGLAGDRSQVNFFFLFSGEYPVILYTLIFFVLYAVGIWCIFKFSNFFSNIKTGKLGHQVSDLKAELYDKQGALISNIKKEFDSNLTAYIETAEKDRKTYKTETDKILNNLQFEITTLTGKIEELKKQK